jgi:hypothetical protein
MAERYVFEFLAYLTSDEAAFKEFNSSNIDAVRVMTRFGLSERKQNILLSDAADRKELIRNEIVKESRTVLDSGGKDTEKFDLVIPPAPPQMPWRP